MHVVWGYLDTISSENKTDSWNRKVYEAEISLDVEYHDRDAMDPSILKLLG
jgi:hypothetical protein